jgi:hypothetical protein
MIEIGFVEKLISISVRPSDETTPTPKKGQKKLTGSKTQKLLQKR